MKEATGRSPEVVGLDKNLVAKEPNGAFEASLPIEAVPEKVESVIVPASMGSTPMVCLDG